MAKKIVTKVILWQRFFLVVGYNAILLDHDLYNQYFKWYFVAMAWFIISCSDINLMVLAWSNWKKGRICSIHLI